MKIHLVSDLHLAFADYKLDGEADLLIVAGDTIEATKSDIKRSAQRFFNEELTKYPQVLMVLGNHEFYGCFFNEAFDNIREAVPANTIVMENDSVDIGDTTFLGATLWTDCNKGDPLTLQLLNSAMNDYRKIKYTKQPFQKFTPSIGARIHRNTRQWLEHAVRVSQPNTFVITHHAPSYASVHPSYSDPYYYGQNGGYASDLTDIMLDHPKIDYWVHGHSHWPQNYMVGSCNVLCNPRGYHGYEQIANDYKPLEIFL